MSNRTMLVFALLQVVLLLIIRCDAQSVQLMLEGQGALPNITIVLQDELGGEGMGLICQSNDSNTFTSTGVWRAPTGATVPLGPGSSGSVYMLRAPLPTLRITLYRSSELDGSSEGVYTCTIPDSNGQEFTLYAGLYRNQSASTGVPIIQDPPIFQLLTPLSQHPPSFLVTCVSSMFPPTRVNWTRNGAVLKEGSLYHLTQLLVSAQETIFNNTVIVTSDTTSLSGVFACAVSNDRTSQPVVGILNVTEPDSPPINITSDFLGSGDVEVSWLPPPGVPVQGYHVLYEQVGVPSSEQSITTPNTSVIVRGLTASATYNFSVIAFSDLPSARSSPISVTLTVASTPFNLSLTHFPDPTVVLVSWDPPIEVEGVVGYIVVHFSRGFGCEGMSEIMMSRVDNTVFNLTGLEEDEQYSVQVRAISRAAVGPPTNFSNFSTAMAAPSAPPMSVEVIVTNPSTINVSWTAPPCIDQNGVLSGYRVRYNDTGRSTGITASRIMDVTSSSIFNTSLNPVVRLEPFRNYSIEVAAVVNGSLIGVYSNPLYTSLVGVPGAITNGMITPDISSVTVRWNQPSNIDRAFTDIITYIVRNLNITNSTIVSSPTTVSDTTVQYMQRIPLLNPNATVRINVTSISTFSNGPFITLTSATLPIPVIQGVAVSQFNVTTVRVSWTRQQSMDIVEYRVYYNSSERADLAGNVTVNSIDSEVLLLGLEVGLAYEYEVVAIVMGKEGARIEGTRSQPFSFTIPTVELLDATQRIIVISVFSGIGGLILIILVTIIFLGILRIFTRPLLAHKEIAIGDHIPLVTVRYNKQAEADGCPAVVKAPTDIHAIAGQEVVLRVEFSGHPAPEFSWKFGTRELVQTSSLILTKDGALVLPRVSSDDDGHYFVTAKNKHGSIEQRVTLVVYNDDVTSNAFKGNKITTVKISLSEFGQYVSDLHADNDKNFKEQFKLLPDFEKQKTMMSAAMNQHRQLNRQQTILAYDDNRVELTPLKRYLDCQHDYVNASYVDGYSKLDAFIATQGPLDRTIVDFWRMVWKVRSPTIVMVTNLQEDMHIKSSRYWPSAVGKSEKYGPFKVTLEKEESRRDYIVRTLKLNDAGSVPNLVVAYLPAGSVSEPVYNPLIIKHYQYISWPEYSAPQHIDTLLAFQREATASHSTCKSSSPMVVHCSCGVGRTGAFILLSNALVQAEKEKIVDMPAALIKLRKQRMQMVQTATQYVVVHDALLEGAVCGITHFPVLQMSTKIQQLCEVDKDSELNGFESQFKVLEAVTTSPSDTLCSVALRFKEKNRCTDYLPTDKWRVPLLSEQPDYIHASFVPSYLSNRAYIVTQGPLPDTRRDFFKMIFDRDVVAIVMLTGNEDSKELGHEAGEENEELCSHYWSAKDSQQQFGEYEVTLKTIHHNQGFTRRMLHVTNTKTGESRKVPHFQILTWSSDGTQYNIGAIVNTINLVTMAQRKTANCPILVHCSDGVGRSAMLCAAMATLEQTRSHATADVFQIVKNIRSQLLGAIGSWEQYRAVHFIVEEYINLFSTTANFKQHT